VLTSLLVGSEVAVGSCATVARKPGQVLTEAASTRERSCAAGRLAVTSLPMGLVANQGVIMNSRIGIIGGSIVGVLVLFIVSIVGSYNGLVDRETRVDQAVADLEVQLQRRFDLIPNLVSAVEGALEQERDIIDSVTEARTRYAGAGNSADRLDAAADLEGALSRLLVVVENYPQVASLQNVRDLQVQLEGTENRVAQARRSYNEVATDYNRAVRRFPRAIVASLFGFEKRDLFEASAGADEAPEVDLNPGE
jgi:LemA protein